MTTMDETDYGDTRTQSSEHDSNFVQDVCRSGDMIDA